MAQYEKKRLADEKRQREFQEKKKALEEKKNRDLEE